MAELNSEFGNLLTQGLRSIAAREHKAILALEDELGYELEVTRWSIEKWRQGHIPSSLKQISYLANVCVHRGGMDKHWLQHFLTQARFPDKDALIEELFSGEYQLLPFVHHNLPGRPYDRFIGREKEMKELERFLSRRHRLGIICLSGIAGVGKTALALEIAHRLCENNAILASRERFEAIVWVTAKQAELLPVGLTARSPTFSDLNSLYRAIAEVLDLPAITRAITSEERELIVAHALTEHRVLLVLDNLEDVDDSALMVFLRDLPTPSKAIVTTRHRIGVAVSIQLQAFNEAEARELIRIECQRRNLTLTLENADRLLRRTGYLPLAIVRTIGRMAWRGSSVDAELRLLGNPNNDIYEFCFGKSIALIQGRDAHKLFMALALFTTDATRDALGSVAGFGEDILDRDEGLSDLEVLSLVNKEGDRFNLEPLTKVKARAELAANPEFEREARERWVEWYLKFVREYGGWDWKEWHVHYNRVEQEWQNLLAVFEWCAVHEQYQEMRAFWQGGGVCQFAHVYGYWRDKLTWLDWLIQMANKRKDWPTAVEATKDKAYTLILMGRYDEADAHFRFAWNLHEQAEPRVQVYLALEYAVLFAYQKNVEKGRYWLDYAETLLQRDKMDDQQYRRILINRQRYYGLVYFQGQNYDEAERYFRNVLEQAETIGWQRATIYAQNYLADIAIAQDRLDDAEDLLQIGLIIADRNKDKRRTAFYKRSFARLHQKRKNIQEARSWALEALDGFKRLGMQQDAMEMDELLQDLEG